MRFTSIKNSKNSIDFSYTSRTNDIHYIYIYTQYLSKVWTHFFSFFKTAVEIGPVG